LFNFKNDYYMFLKMTLFFIYMLLAQATSLPRLVNKFYTELKWYEVLLKPILVTFNAGDYVAQLICEKIKYPITGIKNY
jgi:hypothetical protein